jgi:hypothetical protein
MAVVIALRPETERGREILDELEKETHEHPMQRLTDGTRRFHLTAEDADVDAFDSKLDEIDRNWRHHVTNWHAAEGFPWDTVFGAHPVDRGGQRDYPPGD